MILEFIEQKILSVDPANPNASDRSMKLRSQQEVRFLPPFSSLL